MNSRKEKLILEQQRRVIINHGTYTLTSILAKSTYMFSWRMASWQNPLSSNPRAMAEPPGLLASDLQADF